MTVCYWCGAKDTLADIGKELDDGKYKMVQCSKCKNAYYVVNKEKMKKPKPMTNEDWFCGLNTEEKARFICNLMKGDDLYLGVMSARDMIKDELNHGKDGKFVIYEWLKEIHQ